MSQEKKGRIQKAIQYIFGGSREDEPIVRQQTQHQTQQQNQRYTRPPTPRPGKPCDAGPSDMFPGTIVSFTTYTRP